MATGAHASAFPSAPHRLVVVLTVPARAFAACFVAAAAAIAGFIDNPPDTDAERHFQFLASLSPGTPVTRRRGNSIQRGRLLGVASIDGVDRVSVEFKNEVHRLPQSLCTQIQPTDGRAGAAMGRRRILRDPRFLRELCPGLDATTFCTTSRLDCLVVGNQGTLRDEFMSEQFTVKGAGRLPGTLQDLARVHYLADANDAFRSALLPAGAELREKPVSPRPPRVAIFDGSRAFINWRSQWEQSQWVVILDRSAPSAIDGADAVAQRFAMRVGEAPLPADIPVPRSIEAVAYLEAR